MCGGDAVVMDTALLDLYACARLCRMPSLSELLQEVRGRAEVCLYSGGRVAEVWAAVMDMANLPLPPCSKYHHVAAETMVIGNSSGSNRKEVRGVWSSCEEVSSLSRPLAPPPIITLDVSMNGGMQTWTVEDFEGSRTMGGGGWTGVLSYSQCTLKR